MRRPRFAPHSTGMQIGQEAPCGVWGTCAAAPVGLNQGQKRRSLRLQ